MKHVMGPIFLALLLEMFVSPHVIDARTNARSQKVVRAAKPKQSVTLTLRAVVTAYSPYDSRPVGVGNWVKYGPGRSTAAGGIANRHGVGADLCRFPPGTRIRFPSWERGVWWTVDDTGGALLDNARSRFDLRFVGRPGTRGNEKRVLEAAQKFGLQELKVEVILAPFNKKYCPDKPVQDKSNPDGV